MSNSSAGPPADFPSTEWSRMPILRDRTHPDYQPTLDHFVARYWQPIFYYLLARGVPVHQAEDWTQEFLLHFAIEGEAVGKANEQKGRFRAFLRHLLRNFVSNQGPNRTTRQKAFEGRVKSLTFVLGDEERSWEPAGADPEEEFDRRWTAQVIEGALRQLRELTPHDWPIFAAYRLPDGDRPTREALAGQFGITVDDVLKVHNRSQKRFERLLRAELREEDVAEADMDEEIGRLLRSLAK